MKVHSNIDNFRAVNPVVTMGMFDGVHLGHSALLAGLNELAEKSNGESVVLTFWPHPRVVLAQDVDKLQFLTTLEEKTRLISEAGIHHMVILPFTKELAGLSAEDFLREYLVKKMGLNHLLVGFNHRFGHRGTTFKELGQFSQKLGFKLTRFHQVLIDQAKPSSTAIRNLLKTGDVWTASRLLGHFYSLNGRVIGGKRLGRTMGFPTANIEVDDPIKLIPLGGVYACRVNLLGEWFGGMINIGYRPTVDSGRANKSLEVHIFDFNREVYSEKIMVEFIARTRGETRFPDLEALRQRLKRDEMEVRAVLSDPNLMRSQR
jgi:riboflavin kinase/FMN adenylyltransferase